MEGESHNCSCSQSHQKPKESLVPVHAAVGLYDVRNVFCEAFSRGQGKSYAGEHDEDAGGEPNAISGTPGFSTADGKLVKGVVEDQANEQSHE